MASGRAIRASDADREHAVTALREQYAEGRLTLAEFDERISAAYTAKTWSDLDQLTSDLPVDLHLRTPPAGRPVPAGAPAPASAPAPAGGLAPGAWRLMPLLPILIAWVAIATVGASFHGRGHVFPLIPLAVIGTVALSRRLHPRRRSGG